jgi:hypothetical protein
MMEAKRQFLQEPDGGILHSHWRQSLKSTSYGLIYLVLILLQ